MQIGENIREHRKKVGLSQKELGKRLGVSQQNIAQYETGKRMPKLETVRKIAKALDTDIGNLLKVNKDGISSYDFTSFNYEEIKAALCDIMPDIKEVIENENNDREAKLLLSYEQLNDIGQNKAVEQVELLTKIPEYQKEPKV